MDTSTQRDHISQQYNAELNEIRTQLAEMGGMVQRQVNDAIRSLIEADVERANRVVEGDHKVNRMEVSIDEECVRILARRQPAARDLRLVVVVTKAITDLERVGDEASKISRQAIALSAEGTVSRGLVEIRHIGDKVSRMLRDALDAFARLDMVLAVVVLATDKTVDLAYNSAVREMITHVMEVGRRMCRAVNLLGAVRAEGGIDAEARNVAQYVVLLVLDDDVRHDSDDEIHAQIDADVTDS